MKPFFACILLLWWGTRLGASDRIEAVPSAPSPWAQAQRGLPLISAFEVPPTRHNGEVWAFASAGDGRLWVGSDKLFLFDGKTRESIDLPFATYAVRALAHDAVGRLWLGAIGEIGHLEPTATGSWRYISAQPNLKAAGIEDLRDIWQAHGTPQGVVFIADQQVLRWNGTRFERWVLPSPINLLSNQDGDDLWIFQSGVGLLRMEAAGPRLIIPAQELPGAIVFWALTPGNPSPVSPGAGLLVGTPDGIFVRSGRAWKKLEHVSAPVASKLPLHATMIDGQTFAVGCYLGGLVIGSTDDRLLATIDRASGLPHDTITGLWYDGQDGLWAGYPGGMARIEAHGAVSAFDSRTHLDDTPVLKVLEHRGATYVLSRRMLSQVEPGTAGHPATVSQVVHLPIPFSDAVSLGKNLWFSGYGGGIWRLVNGEPQAATAPTGFIFSLLGAQNTPFTLFYLHNTQIEALRPGENETWHTQSLNADAGAYPLNVVRDPAGDIWVATVTGGVFRYRLEAPAGAPTRLRLVKNYRGGQGLPQSLERPQLTQVGGRVFLLSEKEILGYERGADAFVRVPGLEPFVAVAATPTDDPAEAYWVVRRSGLDPAAAHPPVLIKLHLENADRDPTWQPLAAPNLADAGSISALSFTSADGGTLWIAASQALVRLSLSHLGAPPQPPPLRLVRIERNGTAIPLPAHRDSLPFEADTSRLHLELAGLTRAAGDNFFVQASLGGLSDERLKMQTEPSFDFTGLRPGHYVFRAQALDSYGQTGTPLEFSFSVEAPWYQRGPAIVAYVLAGLLLILAGVRWRLRQLHRQNEHLNQLVDERTGELARANMVKNEFFEHISHEIRNPLNGISNLVDLLHDAPLQPEVRRLAESLGRSTEHLKRVFSDVLGYTRLEYGHVNLESVPFSLAQLLEDIVALFAVEARERHSPLAVQLSADLADGYRGDAEKIRTIVTNYVGNALKYASPGAIDLIVRGDPPDPAGTTRIWIGVRDHGPGLSAVEQAKLFKKFSRGVRAKASGISGTGLGLATCLGLAELMDGKAGVTSEEGQGSTFWVELPLEPTALPAHPAPSTAAPASPPAAGPLHALIVDDQEYNQVVLRGIARRLGYEAEVASHAGEVWPLIEQRSYATVFLDWELPGLNGGEIARKLRAHPHTRDTVIIATTAHDSDDIRQQCLEAQMDGYALKPFDTARIRAVLNEASARRTGRAAAVNAADEAEAAGGAPGSQLFLSAFAYFAAGDPSRAQQAVSLYLQTLDQELAALQTAIAANNREAVARQAHRIRSHAGLVNGLALYTAAQKLVDAARNPAEPDWHPYCQAVLDESATLKRSITSLPTTPPAGA